MVRPADEVIQDIDETGTSSQTGNRLEIKPFLFLPKSSEQEVLMG